MKKIAANRYLRMIAATIALMLIVIGASPRLLPQQGQTAANDNALKMSDLIKLPGRVIAEGRNTTPVGQYKLLKYRVEELQLPRSVKVELHGQQVEVDKAFRLTITGGPFPVRALPAVLWVDDQIVGYGVENERLSAVAAITFDRSVLREGGTLSLSYGEEKEGRVRLPEKLNLNREGGTQ